MMEAIGQGREPVFFRRAASERPFVLRWMPYIHVYTGSTKRLSGFLKMSSRSWAGKVELGRREWREGLHKTHYTHVWKPQIYVNQTEMWKQHMAAAGLTNGCSAAQVLKFSAGCRGSLCNLRPPRETGIHKTALFDRKRHFFFPWTFGYLDESEKQKSMPGEVVVTWKVTLTTGIVGKSSWWTYLLSGFRVLRFLLKRRYFSLEPDMGT